MRGQGATLDGRELRAEGPGFGLEVVGIESAKPERTLPLLEALAGKAYRIRAIGSIAISLCYVAGGRFDGMLTGRACRSVDAAGGQLIAREAGAEVAFAGAGLDVSLDLDARFHVAAALDRRAAGHRARGPGARRAAGASGMSAHGFVDWGLAERVALALGGNDGTPAAFDQDAVDAACADAVDLVLDYSRLRPAGELPQPELVDRAEWARIGLRTMRELSDQLERRVADGLSLPGPLGGLARSLAGAAAGAEAGVAVGYGARKVLGQYDVPLVPTERQPRLVFVGPNLAAAHLQLGEDPELFLRWIAIHESTHSIQFASVPWLRPHLGELLDAVDRGRLGAAGPRLDRAGWPGVFSAADPRAAVRKVLRGDLARLLAGPEQARTLDRLQAAMSVIEGHAEHVMDAAAGRVDPGYARLRERLEARRASRGGLGEVILRILGLELKLRQYTARQGLLRHAWSPRRASRG